MFYEIEYDDSLRQCLTSRRGKTYGNKLGEGVQISVKRVKIGPEIGLFVIFSSLIH